GVEADGFLSRCDRLCPLARAIVSTAEREQVVPTLGMGGDVLLCVIDQRREVANGVWREDARPTYGIGSILFRDGAKTAPDRLASRAITGDVADLQADLGVKAPGRNVVRPELDKLGKIAGRLLPLLQLQPGPGPSVVGPGRGGIGL